LNKPQLFNHPVFGSLPVLIIENDEWFGATEAAKALSFSNPYTAIPNHVDDDDLTDQEVIDSIGRKQVKKFINESGLYNLIFGAAKQGNNPEIKEKAKAYKRWVTSEVLPSIRKHGAYMTPETIERAILNPDFLIQLGNQLKIEQTARLEAEARVAEQARKLKEQETPVAIYQLAISAQNTMSMNEVAKALGTGRTRLFRFLREEGVIMKDKPIPYQRFIDAGYFTVRERPRASGDTVVNDSVTRVYAKGFDYVAKLMQRRAK